MWLRWSYSHSYYICFKIFQYSLKKLFFKQLDSLITPFLWGHKDPRIGKKYLCRPKSAGGLALPNF